MEGMSYLNVLTWDLEGFAKHRNFSLSQSKVITSVIKDYKCYVYNYVRFITGSDLVPLFPFLVCRQRKINTKLLTVYW